MFTILLLGKIEENAVLLPQSGKRQGKTPQYQAHVGWLPLNSLIATDRNRQDVSIQQNRDIVTSALTSANA